MRRLACAVFALGCTTVYQPFPGGGDGGPVTGTTVIGGNSNPDLAGPADLSFAAGAPSGTITIHSSTQSTVSADFTNSSCVTTAASGCALRNCPPGDLGVAGYTLNVGSIHVVAPMANVTVTPQSDGVYLPLMVTGQMWAAAGAMVAVTGNGADYPGFTLSLDGPTPITVVNPLSGAFDLPRSADFQVQWTDGTTGHVTVEIVAGEQTLICEFAVAAGGGIVPGAALGALAAGAATMTIEVDADAAVDTVIQVSAEVPGLDSGGLPFSANVNLR